MAKRPSVKEILEMARRGGPAVPAAGDAPALAPEPPADDAGVEEAVAAEPVAPVPAADVPTPSTLGRPLTLKEKLAAARAGGAPPPAAAPKPAPKPAAAPAALAETADEAPAEAPTAAPAAPAKPLGRPMTLQEKLAAARGGGTQPAAAGAKPAAAKPAAAAPAAKGAGRVLPPLEKITDPHDLAEAARQAGAKKAKELAALAAASAPPKAPSRPRPARPRQPAIFLAAASTLAPSSSVGSWSHGPPSAPRSPP
jgi:cytochrome b6-f complex iron-sulfur subunit